LSWNRKRLIYYFFLFYIYIKMSNHGLFNQLSAQTLAIGTLNDNQATGHEKIDLIIQN